MVLSAFSRVFRFGIDELFIDQMVPSVTVEFSQFQTLEKEPSAAY